MKSFQKKYFYVEVAKVVEPRTIQTAKKFSQQQTHNCCFTDTISFSVYENKVLSHEWKLFKFIM